MSEQAGQHDTSNVETQSASKNLRAELQADLSIEFAKNLNLAAALPNAACESLLALLSKGNSTTEDVIEALALEDPNEPEVSSE